MNSFCNLKMYRFLHNLKYRNLNVKTTYRLYSGWHNKAKHQVFVTQISCTSNWLSTKRLFSSTSTSSLHKVLFVNAASPDENSSHSATDSTVLSSIDATTVDLSSSVINEASTNEISSILSQGIEYIPPPPIPPEVELAPLNALGEPTFASLGFGGWSPINLVQQALEFVHVSLDVPWWGTIAICTVVIRLCVFPLIIKSQRNSANLANVMPGLQALQAKMTEARLSGNELQASICSNETQQYMKKNKVNIFGGIYPVLIQAPVFISMFIGLRRCANLPVESFQTGGLYWFTNLSVADPFYILPLVTAATMYVTIMIGADGTPSVGGPGQAAIFKYLLRAMPIVMLPFIIQFPSAILCYWTTTNFISLAQVGFLKIPAVRNYFQIPKLIQHDPKALPPKKGFKDSMNQAWQNSKVTSELNNRRNVDEIRFRKAGYGPLVKTYKHNPLEKPPISVKAKPRS